MERRSPWGEHDVLSLVDRFGIWLSELQIRRQLGEFEGRTIADIGCGYHAAFTRGVLKEVAAATLADLSLAADLKSHPKVHPIEGILPDALAQIPADSLDLIICNNLLEHLWQPVALLEHIRRILKPEGRCFLNVPSWRGRLVLEAAAFRFQLTSKQEIDEHKAYYDVRELWSLLVRSGFKPSQIKCKSHKFGLNTFAVCSLK